MMYLLDTDRVADFLKGRMEARTLLAKLASSGLAISLITYGEIYDGIYAGANRATHEAGFHRFLSEVKVLPPNRRIMRRFAQVRGDLRRTGQLIGDADIIIAATALHYNLIVVTRNIRHFDRVPGLTLYYK